MRHNRFRRFAFIALLCACAGLRAQGFDERLDVQRFVDEVAAKHQIEAATLRAWFRAAQTRPDIIRIMDRAKSAPAPWYRYALNHVNPARIDGGVKFWQSHAHALRRARAQFGVPEEVIIAILGVETHYGKYPQNYPVFDALATLAFDYPRRADFFRAELEQFLLLAREGFDPRRVRGSFAGAMGLAQFLPGSYRAWAVDFDGDGRRDLFTSPADAIGSIANYLSGYGWDNDQPVAVRALNRTAAADTVTAPFPKPERSVDELAALGYVPTEPLAGGWLAAPIALEMKEGTQHWLGLNNFYVITRYNNSTRYAMAVHQLAQAIRLSAAAEPRLRTAFDDTGLLMR